MNFAHYRLEKEGVIGQSAAEHCRNTARYTALCLHDIGLCQTGTLIGLVHDCGKVGGGDLRGVNVVPDVHRKPPCLLCNFFGINM